ncbi:MAG: hypothetical protein CBD18_09170 [Opitutales bacterium TMED158]|nr:MAG: hypothetical protein CBD18_09170 [Opitutales bacterium TMED158]
MPSLKRLAIVLMLLLVAFSHAQNERRGRGPAGIVRPRISDTVPVNVYADNWFKLYINGKLIAIDSIDFMPHNVISVQILPEFPMTIAVMAKDNANATTALEYNDSNIGDGGFILKIGDDIVTDSSWKAKNFFHGPLNGGLRNPRVEHKEIPENWFAVDFDDSNWENATEYSEGAVSPKGPFYEADFSGAKFIWTSDLELDNTIVFRKRIDRPGWKARWNVGDR